MAPGKRIIFTTILVLHHILLLAQATYSEQIYSNLNEALSHHHVQAIVEDHFGYIWLGTNGGLDRFDGHNIISIQDNPTDSLRLANSEITCLLTDSDSILWIGTAGGGLHAFRYDSSMMHFQHSGGTGNSVHENFVVDLVEDDQKNIWIGTRHHGLCYYDKTSQKVIRPSLFFDKSHPKEISSLALNGDQLWIGTHDSGLFKMNLTNRSGSIVPLTEMDKNDTPGITDIHIDKKEAVWVATIDHSIFHFVEGHLRNKIVLETKDVDVPVENNIPWVLGSDQLNNLLVGTHGGGLRYLSKSSYELGDVWSDSRNETQVLNAVITDITLDDDGAIWVATAGTGVVRLRKNDPQLLFRYPAPLYNAASRPVSNFQYIHQSNENSLWISTWGEGLHNLDLETGKADTYLNSSTTDLRLPSNIVWKTHHDHNGNIWAATHEGLVFIDSTRMVNKIYNQEKYPAMWHNAVRSVFVDAKGNTWIGTFGGLNLKPLDLDTITKYSLNHEHYVDEPIVFIFEDSRSFMWIGSLTNGLFCLQPETNTVIYFSETSVSSNQLTSNRVSSICEDDSGTIWVATNASGLNEILVSNSVAEKFVVKNHRALNSELPTDHITLVAAKPHGGIIISSDKGMFWRDEISHRYMQIYGPNKLPPRYQGAWPGLRDNFFIPMEQSIFNFESDSLHSNGTQQTCYITSISIGGRPKTMFNHQDTRNELRLRATDRDITFGFSSLSFNDIQQQKYQYQLTPIDLDWLEVSEKTPFADYRRLPPGRYQFKVRAKNEDGTWSRETQTLNIFLETPFDRSTTAYLLYVSAALSLLALVRKIELRRKIAKSEALNQREISKVRARLYANFTHEFRTPLAIIMGTTTHMLARAQKKYHGGLHSIERNASRVLKLIDKLMEISRLNQKMIEPWLQQVDIVLLAREVLASHQILAQKKSITLSGNYFCNSYVIDTDPHLLEIVLSNIITNAIKYSPDTRTVHLDVTKRNTNVLIFKVTDQGIGIKRRQITHVFERHYQATENANRTGFGIGLSLAKEFINLLNGRIKLTSKFGQGTEVTVELPINQGSVSSGAPFLPALTERENFDAIFTHQQYLSEAAPTVLLMEDNLDLLNFLVNVLQSKFNLLIAEDGQKGFEMSQLEIPDLIICDIKMPKMDGFQVCEAVKGSALSCHIPFIILTAMVNSESKVRGINLGADLYLTKPFLVEELLAHIYQLINTSRKFEDAITRDTKPTLRHLRKRATTRQDLLFDSIEKELKANLADPNFHISDLSNSLFISRSKLFRKIKGVTGMSPNRYLRVLRLMKAKNALSNLDYSMSQVADSCGFNNAEYLARIFRNEFGCTPSEFRKNPHK